MGLLQAIFIFLGLSLDSFVLMMDKGARMRKLEIKKALLYSIVYSLAAESLFLLGYLSSYLFKNSLNETEELSIAIFIIFAIGIYVFFKSFKRVNEEERADDSFTLKKCFKLALITNIDTFCLGVGFSFSEVYALEGATLIFIISMIIILSSLYIGYSQGSKYARVVGMSGGALIIAFSIFLFAKVIIG